MLSCLIVMMPGNIILLILSKNGESKQVCRIISYNSDKVNYNVC